MLPVEIINNKPIAPLFTFCFIICSFLMLLSVRLPLAASVVYCPLQFSLRESWLANFSRIISRIATRVSKSTFVFSLLLCVCFQVVRYGHLGDEEALSSC